MKAKRIVSLTVAASFAGLVAVALTGCEWFDFEKVNKADSVSGTLGYSQSTGAWLTSREDSAHSDTYLQYQAAISRGELDPSVTYLEFLKAMHDDSASLSNSLRASVAIASAFRSGNASLGSGVIYAVENTVAYIITNYHVVYRSQESGADKIGTDFYTYLYGDKYDTNYLNSSSALKATYVGGAAECDIAVLALEIPSERVSFVQSVGGNLGMRNSDNVTAGEKIYAVGNPLGGGLSVVSGVVSVEAEYVTMPRVDSPAQDHEMLEMRIDAPVNHGNSGGGVFDSDGKLVGIVNGGQEETVQGANIAITGFGFAIPANRAVSVAQSIIDNYKENGSGAATYGHFATTETAASRGEFNPDTLSVDIIETVRITRVGSGSPFGREIEGKNLAKIVVTDDEGNVTVSKNIVRRHQVDTIFYNLRLGDSVELTFEDGSTVRADYDQKSNFGQN